MIIFRGFILILIGGTVIAYLVHIGKIKPFRGVISTTINGEIVKSKSEKRIADFLHNHGISYIYEKSLTLNTKKGKKTVRPDFYLPEYGVYIEFRGLHTKKYIKQKARKIAQYKKNNISYISLHADDLKRLGKKLHKFL